jgi:hypothetical protein
MMIGIDMQPGTNHAASLGRLQPCVAVEAGDEFAADIFIANVQALAAWELRLDYDPDIVTIQAADYSQLLISAQPAGIVFPYLFEEEQYGRYFLAATEINGTPDSGSGVLAHLSLKAEGEGISKLKVVSIPSPIGPRITGAGGAPIGDSTGDGVWDADTVAGEVVVGGDCQPATPIPTPPPPTSGAGSAPGETTGGSSGGSDDEGGDSASGDSSVAVIGDGDSGDEGDAADNGGTANGGDTGASDNAAGEGDGGDGPPGTSSRREDDGGGYGVLPLVLGIGAGTAIALGAVILMVFRSRRPTF